MKQLARLLALIFASSAFAESCPTDRNRDPERASLLEALRITPDIASGQAVADKVWRFWMTAPDTRAQVMLDQAMSRRLGYNLEEAESTLDALVAYCPDFPEGWNQRAFVRFLREDFAGSLADIDKTLSLEPAHFGALAGQAQIFLKQGRVKLAQLAIARAVKVHPWLHERALLEDGEDI